MNAPPSDSLNDFRPTANWRKLRLRAELLRQIREFFHGRGFLEVETPILSADVVVDRHLDPLSTLLANDPRKPDAGRRLWLQTSPEFGMKRLMAAGGEAIYQITRVFRSGESGRLHNPEFTMVEWYRRDDHMAAGMRFLSELCDSLLKLGPAMERSYRTALEEFADVDPLTCSSEALRSSAADRDLTIPTGLEDDDRDSWLDLLFVELVQPKLGLEQPTILFDYPASQAALARIRDDDPSVAERFELFVHGVELANGYHELLDPHELRRRAAEANRHRQSDGKPPLPEDNRLLAAMEHGLPSCCGVALGFDRLVMIAAGAKSIDEVVAFPIERA